MRVGGMGVCMLVACVHIGGVGCACWWRGHVGGVCM